MTIPFQGLFQRLIKKISRFTLCYQLFCFLLAGILSFNKPAEAQVAAYYNFSQSSGTYTPGVSTTSTTPADVFTTFWDDDTAVYALPFNFTYNGVLYTSAAGMIGVDSDGWITFSNGYPTMTGTVSGGSWISLSDHTGVYLNGTGNDNGFAGFNCDLNEKEFATFTGTLTSGNTLITGVSSVTNIVVGTRLTGTGITDGTVVTAFTATTITMSSNATSSGSKTITPRSSIYAFTTGTAPNRKFIIQWTQVKRYSAPGNDLFNFQLVLNEGNANPVTQTLQVVYGTCTSNSIETLDAQVGLRGTGTSDFNARRSNTGWATTTAAIANTDLVRFSNTIFPAPGLTFTWSPCTVAPGAPGTISGSNPVCAHTTAVYSIPAVAGATIYTWTYSGTGASFTSTTNSPSVSVSYAVGATSGTLSVTVGNICGTNPASSSLAITVMPAPAATISYPSAAYCNNAAGIIPVTQTGTSGGTYTVNPPTGLTINASGSITPSGSTAGTYTVIYTFTDGTCSNTATASVVINSIPSLTASATPALFCSGGNAQLQATVAAAAGYTVSSIPYVSTSPSATPTVLWNNYFDDEISTAIALPFSFTYFGQAITQFYVSTNGYIQLQTNSGLLSPGPQTLPDATDPDNVVALAWEDLVVDPSTNPGAYVRYFVNGVAPNRIMVIDYFNLRFLGGTGADNVTGQIRLYESDNHIEVAAGTVDDDGNGYFKTMGIENNNGTLGIAPAGRNNLAWNFTTAEAWSFNPDLSTTSYLWSPATFLNSTTISNPVATAVSSTTVYNVQATNSVTGCMANASATVTVSPPLNGTYTVGAAGNYPTLTAAVNAYNTICISGPVVFSLIDASYAAGETFPIVINSNAYASIVNTLTIKPASGVSPVITGSSNVAIIKLNGADYVTIDGSNTIGGSTRNLSLVNSSSNSSTSTIVWLSCANASNGATNNTVKNCVFTGNAPTTTYTALMSSGTAVGEIAEIANGSNTYQNNLFTKCQTAIALVGPAGNESGNSITGNTIGSVSSGSKLSWSGIELYQQDGCQVSNNTIFGITNSDFDVTSGIAVYGTNSGSIISGNKITDIKQTNSAGVGANGIYLGASSTAANITVVNNFIWDIAGYGSNGFGFYDNGYGLVVDEGGGYKIYHNTVVLNTNPTFSTNHRSAAILVSDFVTTASSVDLRNNIFGNTQTTGNGNSRYAILSTAANSVYSNIDYNDFYSTGSGNLLCQGTNGTQYNTIALLRTNLGSNLNSVSVVPTYINAASDLHLQSVAGNSAISNLGTIITGISSDYDAQTRNGLTPDIGADEWVMPNTGSWVGKTSTDWLVATNWEANAIPDGTTDVSITGGYAFMPAITTTQAVRDISFSAPVPANTPLLTINAGTLQVNRAITRTGGTINGTNGTVEMNGTVAQTIPAGLFLNNNLKNLVIGNTNAATGVTLGGSLDIYRSVIFSLNGLKLTTGNFLTFKSTAAETAWLGDVTGKTISGNATVERYIPNHTKAWQFLSVPTSGQTVKAAWQEGSTAANNNPVTGYGTQLSSNVANATTHPAPGFDVYTPAGPSMKTYDTTTKKWVGILNTGIQIANPKGYMLFVRGDRSVIAYNQAATSTVLRTTGKLYTTGADAPPVINLAANTFETIGNPYASAIDLTLLSRSGGVQDVFYVWDPKLTTSPSVYGLGAYQTLTRNGSTYDVTPGGGSYSTGTCKTIESGQAFFVRAPSAIGSVTFTESAKTGGSKLITKPENIIIGKQLRTNLKVILAGEPVLIDGNLLQYAEAFSNNIDIDDAIKLENAAENIGILSSGKNLVVERRKNIQVTDTIFYRMGQLRLQQYQLEFIANDLEQPGLAAFLDDNYLHTITPVSLHDTTRILFNINDETGSFAADRFRIVFQRLVPTPVTITSIEASRNTDRSISVKWKVTNETGIQLYTIERSEDGRVFSGILSTLPVANNGGNASYQNIDQSPLRSVNFYRIKASGLDGRIQYSAIVSVSLLKDPSGIFIYPNPVVDRILQIQFTNQPSGNYTVQLINKLGQLVYNNTVQLINTNMTRSIQLDNSIAAGTYQLIIVSADGNRISQQVFIH